MKFPIPAGLTLCALLTGPSWAGEERITFDQHGRLVGVSADDGNAVRYASDDVGNVVEVDSAAPGLAMPFSFSPQRGEPGTQITISGVSLTSATLVVAFGSSPAMPAVVTSPSTATIAVPAGLVGRVPVSVTVANQTYSLGYFDASGEHDAPTVTSVTPGCVERGATFTVVGTNFAPTVAENRVQIGSQIVRVVSASATQLIAEMPEFALGAPVRVATIAGQAQSSAPVFAGPCAGIKPEVVLEIDGAPYTAEQNSSLNANTYSFFAHRGDWVSVALSNTISSGGSSFAASVEGVGPDGAALQFSLATAAAPTVYLSALNGFSAHLVKVSKTGYHRMTIRRGGSGTQNYVVRVIRNPVLRPNDSAQVSLSENRSVRYVVRSTAGMRSSVGASNIVSNAGSMSWLLTRDHVASHSGPRSDGSCSSMCGINLPYTGASEDLALVVNTNGLSSLQAKIWFNQDIDQTLGTGQSLTMNLDRPGQVARYRMTAAAGSGFSVNVTGLTLALPNMRLSAEMRSPSGVLIPIVLSRMTNPDDFSPPGSLISTFNLPENGVYELTLDPIYGSTGSATITHDPGIDLDANTPTAVISGTGGGSAKRINLVLDRDAAIGIGLKDIIGTISLRMLLPSGQDSGVSKTCTASTPSVPGCELDFGPVAVAGKYMLEVSGPTNGSAYSALLSVTEDRRASLSLLPTTVDINTWGGNARLGFTATPGQAQTLKIHQLTTVPQNFTFGVFVIRPDGRGMKGVPLYDDARTVSGITGQEIHIRMGDFPLPGHYVAFVDPIHGVTGSIQMSISPGVDTGGGFPQTVVPGPWTLLNISPDQGTGLSIGATIQSITAPMARKMTIEVARNRDPSSVDPQMEPLPDFYSTSSTSATRQCLNTPAPKSCDFDLVGHNPALGPYHVVIWPDSEFPSNATMTVEQSLDLRIDGRSGDFVLSGTGQNARLVFPVPQTENTRITLTRLASPHLATGIEVRVFNSSGVLVLTQTMGYFANTAQFQLPSLPAGTYTLFIDPQEAAKATIRAEITTY